MQPTRHEQNTEDPPGVSNSQPAPRHQWLPNQAQPTPLLERRIASRRSRRLQSVSNNDADSRLAQRFQAADVTRAVQDIALASRMDELERQEAEAEAEAEAASQNHRRRNRRSQSRYISRRSGIRGARATAPRSASDSLTSVRSRMEIGTALEPPPLSFSTAMVELFTGPINSGDPRPFAAFLADFEALHQAVNGIHSGTLPAHLLFTDRDFNEADYEALLALDEKIENKRGATQQEISRAGMVQRLSKSVAANDCCICLEGCSGQVIRKLSCNHQFHRSCIDKWLKQKAVCPVCNRHL